MSNRAPHPPGNRRRTAVWTDHGWPVLAGTATGVAFLGLALKYTWPGAFGIYAAFALFVALVVWSTFSDNGVTPRRAVRIGASAALVLSDVVGLAELFPRVGWAIVAAVSITSPPVVDWVTSRCAAGLRKARTVRHSGMRQDEVDRRFVVLVADLRNDHPAPRDDAREPGR